MASVLIPFFKINVFALFLAILLITGCASMQRPGGGPKDIQAPKILSEKPANLTKNFTSKEIQIELDEFIKLSNESKEISISPSLNRMPVFKVKKNILEITFPDTLEKNTTYTINFGKAIIDYNEGNILKNYSYVFSTGNIIDSLTISGNVVNSLTKKPEIEIQIFIIPVKRDSIFGKQSANIFTTTDSTGNFTFRNLRADTYRIYALKEQGGDRIFNSANEEIGFSSLPVSLSGNVANIKLETFKEEPARFITLDRKIETDGRIFLNFNQQLSNPALKILNPVELDNRKTVEFSAKGDSVLLWLPEITFDSLDVVIQNNVTNLDTVTFRRNRRDTYTRSLTVKDNIIGSGLSSLSGLNLTFSSPVNTFDAGKITILDDSVALKGVRVVKDTLSLRKYKLLYPWISGHNYTLRLAENAFTGPYGGSRYYSNRFKLNSENNYGNLILTVTLPDTANYIVQLIRNEADISRTDRIAKNGKIEYRNMPVGKYNVRIVYDANKNGKWDTGNVKENRQPEKVWNYEKVITLRPNWDQEETILVPPLR